MLLCSWLCTTLVWAADPPRVEGFSRLWVDPSTVVLSPDPTGPRRSSDPPPAAPHSLWLCNPHLAVSVVTVGIVAMGELHPHAEAVVHAVRPGRYTVSFETPDGFVRTSAVRSRVDRPAHCLLL